MREVDPKYEVMAENLGYADPDFDTNADVTERTLRAKKASHMGTLPVMLRRVDQEDKHYLCESLTEVNNSENNIDIRFVRNLHSSIITANQIRYIYVDRYGEDQSQLPGIMHKAIYLRDKFSEVNPSQTAEVSAVRVLSYTRSAFDRRHAVALMFTEESAGAMVEEKIETFRTFSGENRQNKLEPHVSLQIFKDLPTARKVARDLDEVIEAGREIRFSGPKIDKIKARRL